MQKLLAFYSMLFWHVKVAFYEYHRLDTVKIFINGVLLLHESSNILFMSLLHVDHSLNRARWRVPEVSVDDVDLMMRRHLLPEVIARLLCQRGVSLEGVSSFISPTLKNDFPDPFSLCGMKGMSGDIAVSLEEKKRFAIFGDFDVDGATSSAVLHRFLKAVGVDAPIYIPDRLSEGYGPNIAALRHLKEQGADVLFLLDCGTTAFDVVKAGTEMGLRIIIIDHHEAEEDLPECWHVINPKRKDDGSGLGMLAAVGVTFMACVAINSSLREIGFYINNNIKEPDLKSLLDVVALGTVCDMVPLVGVNRLFVRAGFSVPQERMNIGIRALMETAKISVPLTTYDCGFILGPRINAGGRIHKADLGARLLCSDDAEECKNIAWVLHDCNEQRKAIQQEMEAQAIGRVESSGMQNDPLILVDDENWHPGLAGLVAGRLKERFGKPSCVVTYACDLSGRKEGRGSGRSVNGIHIAQAFIDARLAGLLEKGGGHAMAGGFTVLPDKLPELHEFLKSHIATQMENVEANVETQIDGVLSVRGATVELITLLQKYMAPFGQEQAEPVFAFPDVRIFSADVLGGAHVRVQLSDAEGGSRIKAMAFRALETPLGQALLSGQGKKFHMIGHLKINEWQGRTSPELHILDAAHADMKAEARTGT